MSKTDPIQPAQDFGQRADCAALDAQVTRVDGQPWFASIEARFGIPAAVFDPYYLVRPNTRRLHLVRRDHHPPAAPPAQIIGMSFLHTQMKYPKLSTAAAMEFGPHATQNRAQLTSAQADQFLRRASFILPAEQCGLCTGAGYMLAFVDEICLGVGLIRPAEPGQEIAEHGGVFASMIPQAWALLEDRSAFDTLLVKDENHSDLGSPRDH
ncbi:hypothetical protein [Bradymonas sediminis]|uniref:Uncharacterized protein n=1 Tax=Bradymonas sediminis TaxID=1548548 RepID=A0A2Z4FMF9_9DELT|nr:hypothetical protein [Bradymonas sediminis]AWV90159.1 hypothetical protein DN745_12775 [Bradymonas sediminis]TDP75873.1 hypothetical protein DFR33_103220 [Bradymonas sediminis]